MSEPLGVVEKPKYRFHGTFESASWTVVLCASLEDLVNETPWTEIKGFRSFVKWLMVASGKPLFQLSEWVVGARLVTHVR